MINVAVAEKVSALRTEEYFAERSRRADVPKALRILNGTGAGRLHRSPDDGSVVLAASR